MDKGGNRFSQSRDSHSSLEIPGSNLTRKNWAAFLLEPQFKSLKLENMIMKTSRAYNLSRLKFKNWAIKSLKDSLPAEL